MIAAPLLAALVATAASASPRGPHVSTSVDACQLQRITKYRPAVHAVSSLPTTTRTSAYTVHSIVTTCESQSTVTLTLTPEPVTLTAFANDSLAAAARADDGCTSTTSISVSVATEYTGIYPTGSAKRTPAPLKQRAPSSMPGLLGKVFHRLGQNALINQKPFAVDCLEKVTTHLITTTTIEDALATETVTAETPTVYLTPQDGNEAFSATARVNITATLTAQHAPNSNAGGAGGAGGVCTVTTGATSTTTQHLKCAPTNLISQVHGFGIAQTQGDDSNTRGLADGSDPSACCQLCLDTDDCAASEDDPDAGNCFLWYTEPSCGLGFKYSDGNQNLEPGAGFLLQTGCGTIEATDAPTGE